MAKRAASVWFSLPALCLVVSIGSAAAQSASESIEYRVLATSRTSTMEKELNEAAAAGFRYQAVMGGETAFGGDEVLRMTDNRYV